MFHTASDRSILPKQRLERGSILVMSTLILAMLAGLSISTLQNVVTEHQINGQAQDKVLALQAAQYGVTEAKRLLLTHWASGATPCDQVSGCNGANGISVWSSSAFSSSSDCSDLTTPGSNCFDSAQTISNPDPRVALNPPRFFVIALGCDPISKVDRYRIVAKGFGASVNTVAYAESTFTIPLTGQNSSVGAPTTAIVGVAVASDMTSINSTSSTNFTNPVTYNLAKSTNSSTLFFNATGGSSCTNQNGKSGSTGASCERNCMGEVRVKGYSYYNNNSSSCPWVYGDWVSGANQSQIQLKESSGVMAAVQCGPCQTALPVPVAVCASEQYNTCTNACVIMSCPAGQYLNGGSCSDCPAGFYSDSAGATSCMPCTQNHYMPSGGSSYCAPCPEGASAPEGSRSCSCPAGQSWNGTSCATCSAGSYSAAGATSCTPCTQNHYMPSGGSSYCAPCPEGASAPEGSSSCSCPAGKYWTNNSCETCSAGTYSVAGATSCTSCNSGEYSAAGASSCASCGAGQSWNGSNCVCTTGKSLSPDGSGTCVTCAGGQIVNGQCTCTGAQYAGSSNQFWNGSSCAYCGGAYIASGTWNSTTQTCSCGVGQVISYSKYYDIPSVVCTTCANTNNSGNQYVVNSQCQSCATNQVVNATTNQCTACPAGQYSFQNQCRVPAALVNGLQIKNTNYCTAYNNCVSCTGYHWYDPSSGAWAKSCPSCKASCEGGSSGETGYQRNGCAGSSCNSIGCCPKPTQWNCSSSSCVFQ